MSKFTCDYYFKSIYEIPFSFFHKLGITMLFVDLDNTLVADEERKRPVVFDKWYAALTNENINLIIVSNNSNKKRVADFMEDLPIQWIYRANKQNGAIFNKLITQHNLDVSSVAVIGDRVTTDIVGGKKVGLLTILTDAYAHDHNIFIRYFIRPFEKRFIPKSYTQI